MRNPFNATADYFIKEGWNWKTISLAVIFAGATIATSVLLAKRDGWVTDTLSVASIVPFVWTTIKYLVTPKK